ncbi:CPBP family intramembrane metalloprotease [Omnitrophica bacterium]|nr:CPBP family intramembrane metalloprotease [Candidatus Omnitrophota bacterium]
MKSFLKFVTILFGIVLLSAVLAPLIYAWFPVFKFERIFNRLIMIGVIAASILFVRIRKETLAGYGLSWKPESFYSFGTAFATAFLILVLYAGIRLGVGNAQWAPSTFSAVGWIWKGLFCFGAALLIGVIEEFFFRGFVFRSLEKKLKRGIPTSLILTSIFYSLVHFVNHEKPFIDKTPTFVDSLRLVGAPFSSYLHMNDYWMAVAGLLLFGAVLNWLVIRSGSLYPAIGMHAGAVFFMKLDGFFIHIPPSENVWFGSNQVYDGILGWFFILFLGILIDQLRRRFIKQPGFGP